MQSTGASRRARCGWTFERSEAGVLSPKRLLERVVQHGYAHGEKRLDGVAVPPHLSSLDHPLRKDLIHRGFGEGGRSIAGTVIGQRIGVRV
jgi:hypothetical protein